eukprot:10340414-Lingulodinium_polyedra.AAC.1
MRGAADMECIAEHISELFSRSGMRSEMNSIVAISRVSRCTHSMRRPLRGGRRVECANGEMRGAAAVKCVSERIAEHCRARAGQTYLQT